jgi:hypothetical protein
MKAPTLFVLIYVFRFYKLAFNRLPEYTEMVTDMSFVAGATEAEVYARKAQLVASFILRNEFDDAYYFLTRAGHEPLQACVIGINIYSVYPSGCQKILDEAMNQA